MKSIAKYSVLAISLGLLTACGGSGGGSSVQDNTQIKPDSPKPSIEYVREDLKNEVRMTKQLEVIDPVTNHVIKTINFYDYPKGVVTEVIAKRENAATTYLKALNQAYSAVLAGYTDESGEVGYMAYISGLPTKTENLPKGTAIYHGKSIGRNSSGELSLTANFDTKSVEGRIYNHKRDSDGRALSDIFLQKSSMYTDSFRVRDGADMPATMFRGQAVLDNDRAYYLGAFTGPNAEEVSGTISKYYNGNNTYQVFAGEKQ